MPSVERFRGNGGRREDGSCSVVGDGGVCTFSVLAAVVDRVI